MWRLVPKGTRDPYTAGYDGNEFETQEDALKAIPELRACGPEFDHEWETLKDPEL